MSRIRLLPHHRALIDASAISEQVARTRLLSILKAGDLNGMFGPSQRRAPALLIRLYNVHGEHFSQQLRPDELRTGKDGKLLKHETPAGLKMALDVPPSVRGQLRNPANPLWVTEGIRKVDAPASVGLCAIGLLGVWNCRGKPPMPPQKNRWGSPGDSLLRADAIGQVRALPGCSVLHYLGPLVMFFDCFFRFFDLSFRKRWYGSFGGFLRFLLLLRPFGCALLPGRR
jgi:hypothetical protein